MYLKQITQPTILITNSSSHLSLYTCFSLNDPKYSTLVPNNNVAFIFLNNPYIIWFFPKK